MPTKLETEFAAIEAAFYKLLYLDEDPVIAKLVYASYVANQLKMPPVWIMILGPPGCGKTEFVTAFQKCESSKFYSSINAAGLLSGYDETASVLSDDADGKTICVGDMSSLIEGNRERASEVFGLLRHAYDGAVNRATGKGVIEFTGKIGFLCAATENIDSYRDFMSSLGERFIYIRMRTQPVDDVLRIALGNSARHDAKKESIQLATKAMIDNAQLQTKGVPLDADIEDTMVEVAKVIARGRVHVERDRQGEIMSTNLRSEVPTRVVKQLLAIYVGLHNIGTPDHEKEDILLRICYDSFTPSRMEILKRVVYQGNRATRVDMEKKSLMPRRPTKISIEDLMLLRLVDKPIGGGKFCVASPTLVRAVQRWRDN